MSDIKYGLISKTDARTLEKTIDLILEETNDEEIGVLEVGIYAGSTGNAIREYVISKGRKIHLIGIDSEKDKEPLRYWYDDLIIGKSTEAYHTLTDGILSLAFIDACHCFYHVISDFFCYADKIKKRGFLAFHDTARHIKPMTDYQHGGKDNPDAYISVRKALKKIGLLDDKYEGWELIFDTADENDPAGGITVIRKV